MKVICIDDKDRPEEDCEGCPFDVWFGKIYTVVKEVMGQAKDGTRSICYVFAEFEIGNPYNCWPKYRFAPLSSIDEKELIKERELTPSIITP